jgi:hypothetical protein
MTRFIGAVCGVVLVLGSAWAAPGKDDATAILDKGIKALGGEEKLGKIKACSWKAKGKISFGGMDGDFTSDLVAEGLDKLRSGFEAELGGNKIKGVAVLNGDKGWRKFGRMVQEFDKDAMATEKRSAYLTLTPVTLVPLKGKGFKIATAGEKKIDGKAAVGLKITCPDGKDFTLYFDKKTNLPIQQEAKVTDFMGNEFTQEVTYDKYKEFDGIKKATKIVNKRDGEKFLDQEITEFKVLKKVDAKTFDEPK